MTRSGAVLILSAGLAAAGALLATGACGQDSILPGYWETTDHLLGMSKVERRCVLPRDIAKVMSGPSNHIYTCIYPTDAIGGGRIAFRGRCTDKKGRSFDISGGGTYTLTTLTMTARVEGRLLGLPLAVTASTDAHRLGDVCPPGSLGRETSGG